MIEYINKLDKHLGLPNQDVYFGDTKVKGIIKKLVTLPAFSKFNFNAKRLQVPDLAVMHLYNEGTEVWNNGVKDFTLKYNEEWVNDWNLHKEYFVPSNVVYRPYGNELQGDFDNYQRQGPIPWIFTGRSGLHRDFTVINKIKIINQHEDFLYFIFNDIHIQWGVKFANNTIWLDDDRPDNVHPPVIPATDEFIAVIKYNGATDTHTLTNLSTGDTVSATSIASGRPVHLYHVFPMDAREMTSSSRQFYWWYATDRILTDEEIQQVVDYNEQ